MDNFDDLFEVDEERNADEKSSSERQRIEDLEKQALGRHFQIVAGDVRDHLERIQAMFIVAYEELDNATGKDLCYACVEEPFFRPLWPYLLALSRLVSMCRLRDIIWSISMDTAFRCGIP